MAKQKKAQIQSQIFIYIFAIIVVSLILIIGAKAIFSVKKDTDKISFVNFQTDLKAKAASAASEYGSVQKGEFYLPKDVKQVCFVNPDFGSSKTSLSAANANLYPLIQNSLYSNVLDNVYLIKSVNDVEAFKTQTKIVVPNSVNTHFLCINNTNGKVSFTLKGMSKYVEVSE